MRSSASAATAPTSSSFFDPKQHDASTVRANILDGESVMGDVSKWERFVTTTLDFKNKWVDGTDVGPDPDYTPCCADPDHETSAPPAGGEVINPFSKSNYKPTTTQAELKERRSIRRKISSAARKPSMASASTAAALIADTDVQTFLLQAKLGSYEQAFHELGVLEMDDLRELGDDDLSEIGLKKLEIKRFNRYLAIFCT